MSNEVIYPAHLLPVSPLLGQRPWAQLISLPSHSVPAGPWDHASLLSPPQPRLSASSAEAVYDWWLHQKRFYCGGEVVEGRLGGGQQTTTIKDSYLEMNLWSIWRRRQCCGWSRFNTATWKETLFCDYWKMQRSAQFILCPPSTPTAAFFLACGEDWIRHE